MFWLGLAFPVLLPGSVVMGLPQWGHVPDSTPGIADTGCPQLGHIPVCMLESSIDSALGLKHMATSFSLSWLSGLLLFALFV